MQSKFTVYKQLVFPFITIDSGTLCELFICLSDRVYFPRRPMKRSIVGFVTASKKCIHKLLASSLVFHGQD